MRNILIVDDSSTMRKIISRSLRFSGFDIGEIVQAENGLAGLAALASAKVDLILVDINMPVMDGLSLISHVRKDAGLEAIPIVVITTEGTAAMIKEVIKRGANNLIVKPFTPEQIKEKLSPYLA